MDIYLFSLIVGAVGLGAMALSGLAHHSGGGHAHGGHGHPGGAGGAHGGGHGHAPAHGHSSHGHSDGLSGIGVQATTWMLMSPRFLLAGLFGFGLIGVALRAMLGGVLLPSVAIVGGILIERVLVAPIWKFSMRFASNPANTLESATFGEATVVSNFDRNGQGIVALEVDGQVQQVLATLSSGDRDRGVKVRAGQMVRVEEVDGARHRCTVSAM